MSDKPPYEANEKGRVLTPWRGVWAYVCASCRHLSSEHRLCKDAPIEGPYACLRCECQTTQSAPVLWTDREGYERYMKKHGPVSAPARGTSDKGPAAMSEVRVSSEPCRCGHPFVSHDTEGGCAWTWEDLDGFAYACECSGYLTLRGASLDR